MHSVKMLRIHAARQCEIIAGYVAFQSHFKVIHRFLRTCVYCVHNITIDV